MGLNFNIPMPDIANSFSKGFGLTDNLMQQILGRKQLKQREDQFKEELALKKQQEARMGANSGLHAQILEQQLQGLKNKNNPMYEINQYKALENMIRGNAGKQAPNGMSSQQTAPTEEQGQGLGVFSPEGMQAAQQEAQQAQQVAKVPGSQGGIDLELMKAHPELRAWYKNKFKFDPLADENKASSSLGKVLLDLKQARATGAPPEQIKQLEQYAERLAQGNQGVNLSVDPASGAISFSSGGRGTQANQQEIVNGQVISKPTSAVTTGQQNLQLAAIAREKALEHVQQPYLGLGASYQMGSDLATYSSSKDPKAKKEAGDRLVKAAVSEKIVPEIANLQITSQGGKATVHALEKQEEAIRQGWPKFGKKLAGSLPKELQDRVVEEHNQRLKDISNIRKQYFVKGLPVDINEKTPEVSNDISKMTDEQLRQLAGGR